MPSKLMTIKEALSYKKKYKLTGLEVVGKYLIYTNSVGRKVKVPIKKDMLIYYRGNGRWAVYSPERDRKIIAHKIRIKVKNKRQYLHYGDINPEKTLTKSRRMLAKVGRGKGRKKYLNRRIPSGGGKRSI